MKFKMRIFRADSHRVHPANRATSLLGLFGFPVVLPAVLKFGICFLCLGCGNEQLFVNLENDKQTTPGDHEQHQPPQIPTDVSVLANGLCIGLDSDTPEPQHRISSLQWIFSPSENALKNKKEVRPVVTPIISSIEHVVQDRIEPSGLAEPFFDRYSKQLWFRAAREIDPIDQIAQWTYPSLFRLFEVYNGIATSRGGNDYPSWNSFQRNHLGSGQAFQPILRLNPSSLLAYQNLGSRKRVVVLSQSASANAAKIDVQVLADVPRVIAARVASFDVDSKQERWIILSIPNQVVAFRDQKPVSTILPQDSQIMDFAPHPNQPTLLLGLLQSGKSLQTVDLDFTKGRIIEKAKLIFETESESNQVIDAQWLGMERLGTDKNRVGFIQREARTATWKQLTRISTEKWEVSGEVDLGTHVQWVDSLSISKAANLSFEFSVFYSERSKSALFIHSLGGAGPLNSTEISNCQPVKGSFYADEQ